MASQQQNEWIAKTFGVAAVMNVPAGGASPAPGGGAPPPAPATGDIVGSVIAKIKSDGDLAPECKTLEKTEMPKLLDLMDQLKKARRLESFSDRLTSDYPRTGAALLTVRGDFDGQWQSAVAALGAADRDAIMARAPKDAALDGSKPRKTGKGGDDEKLIDTDAVTAVGPNGVEVQAKISFNSPLAGSLGDTEFTVHIGPGGKLSQFELDLTVLKQKIEKMGVLAPMLDLEASLSLNATVDLDQQATKVIFGKVQGQVKGELTAHLKQKALKGVAFKLTATAGTGGVSVTGSIEITIPGS